MPERMNRDGTFVVVSRDLALAVPAADIAVSKLDALDNWNATAAAIGQRYEAINNGRISRDEHTLLRECSRQA
jgi:hypothetical protein